MRTTIELLDEHRAKLLELAAKRGEKGFSHLVNEAVENYLKAIEDRERDRARALDLLGHLSSEEASDLRERTEKLRGHWR